MTIGDYLKNPYGKGAAFSPSSKQREDLENQLQKIMDKMTTKIYRYRDFVIYHVIVPSTKNDNVTYDVVVEVEIKSLPSGAANIEGMPISIFSNCPSFIFTYAHVFRGRGILCDWLLPKYNKEVRTKPPTQRNEYGIVGLERSMYLALRYLHLSGKTNFGVYQTAGKKINGRTEIINSVRSQEQIMNKVKEKIPEEKDKKKETVEKKPKTQSTPHKKTVGTTSTTKSTKSSKSVKTSSTTKSQKSIKTTKRV